MQESQFDQNEITKRVNDLLIKKKRSLTLDKIFYKISKELKVEDNYYDDSKLEEIKYKIVKVVSDKIMEIYPDGIISLLNEESPKEDEACYIMILNCTQEFYDKFKDKNSEGSLLDKNIKPEKNSELISQPKVDEPEINQIKILDLKYQKLLKHSFDDMDKYNEALIENLINKIVTSNNEIKENISNKEFEFEDFILIFLRILKFMTGLKIHIELSSQEKKIYLQFFGDEDIFDILAENEGYNLQLKPYAYNYAKYTFEKNQEVEHDLVADGDFINDTNKITPTFILKEEDRQMFINSGDKIFPHLQFYELDESNPLNWPPYSEFVLHKNVKFRRYEKNDLFHNCANDPDFKENIHHSDKNHHYNNNNSDPLNNSSRKRALYQCTMHSSDCCSKFRNLDTLRLIHRTIDFQIKFHTLSKHEILDQIIIKRNFIPYGDELSIKNLLGKNLNIFSDKEQSKLINLVRNFYGEKISYYLLWLVFYSKWLIIPALLGITIFILSISVKSYLDTKGMKTFKNLNFNYYDIALFCFCILITIWATMFIKAWKQREKLYCYLWGMEANELNEHNQESFHPDEKIPFLFGHKLPVSSSLKRAFKLIASYIVILILMCANTLIVYLLFRWQANKTNNGKDNSLFWPITIASINGIQIKIMSIIDGFIARQLTNWENYEKYSQRENSLAIKLIMFEFINKYFSLYYVAFIKPYLYEYCIDNNCLKEIEIQLYVILLIKFLFDIFDILVPHLIFKWRKRKLINKYKVNNPGRDYKDYEIKPHSLEHQMICDEMDTLIYEYNDVIIMFGYVCFFSVAAPLTPLIIFIITYVEKFVDCYKMFYLSRVSILEGASGILIYNNVLKIFHFIGMVTNIAVVLFTSPSLINVAAYHDDTLTDNFDFILKFLVLAVLENIVLFMISFMNFNHLPQCKY